MGVVSQSERGGWRVQGGVPTVGSLSFSPGDVGAILGV